MKKESPPRSSGLRLPWTRSEVRLKRGDRVLVRPESVPADADEEVKERFTSALGLVISQDDLDMVVVRWPNGYKDIYPAGTLVKIPLM